ncbi:hypothetical protein GGF46_003678 [Coemansia sp. RSA 552]|nr:hypothetical protein GGF46_003678 [Coemansia sp. RSA 552]
MPLTYGFNDAEDYTSMSADELRAVYSAKASINPNHSVPTIPPTLSDIHERTVAHVGERLAHMATYPYQGALQNFLLGMVGAKRVLEIGTFMGTSAIFFANGLQRNGVPGGPDAAGNLPVTALDISEEYARIARENFALAGVADYVNLIVGDARENLASLEGQQFDLVYLDADKESYKAYYDTILEKNMLSSNGLIIADNTAFDWTTPFIDVLAPVSGDAKALDVPFSEHPRFYENGKAIHEFNEYVRQDPRTEVVMLPLFTGITLIRRLNA